MSSLGSVQHETATECRACSAQGSREEIDSRVFWSKEHSELPFHSEEHHYDTTKLSAHSHLLPAHCPY